MVRSSILVILVVLAIGAVQGTFAKPPRVFIADAAELEHRRDTKTPDAELKGWLDQVKRDAEKALKWQVGFVTSKDGLPPSGDKHDYMSQAPYFWPNPKTPNGLPYIRKDGERNPEIRKFPDHELMDKMAATVEQLALGYYFTHDDRYAAKIREILRGWFVEPATRMNPNLQFAQAVPGQNDGRGTGILESRALTKVVDGIGLIEASASWTDKDQKSVEAWFKEYLDWMTTSKNGKAEAAAKNNHGTWYDIQVASFALFVGRNDLAKKVLLEAEPRIASQIDPDGKQPLELARTKSWSYSTMNLDGLLDLARLGESVGVDLWNFRSKEGGGIRKAIEFLYPFTTGKKWEYQQIEPMDKETLYRSMRRAAKKYTDADYKKMMSTVPERIA
jgi:hypothetical protein